MANERPAANAAEKSPGKPSGRRSGHRSGRSGSRSGQSGSAPARKPGRWTWREYMLQLSVVILGIVITFAGSGLIERWQRQRQIKTVMKLIVEELRENRRMVQHCTEKFIYDRNGMLMFGRYGKEVDKIPQDSLLYYNSIWSLRDVVFMDDAVEVLKLSGLISTIRDKDFLMRILGCYRGLDGFAKNVDSYNRFKMDALKHYYAENKVGDFGLTDLRNDWKQLLDDPMCNSFIGSSACYFGYGDYLWHDIAGVGKTIAAINEKYRFE